jgi:hypothetical protein
MATMIPHLPPRAVLLLALGLGAAPAVCMAQPGADNPQAKPGATILVNPTAEQCKRGWSADMRWTEQQFREFCQRLETSK